MFIGTSATESTRYLAATFSTLVTLVVLTGCAVSKNVPVTVDGPDAKPETQPILPPTPVADAHCDINANLGFTLNTLADELTSQKIPYTLGEDHADEWRDCSGLFLRFSSALAQNCPALESQLAVSAGVKKYTRGANNRVSDVVVRGERTTRTIAEWYHKQGGFTPVVYTSPHNTNLGATDQDLARLIKIRDSIKVGSVLWFSRHKPQLSDDLQPLFDKHINHMGVVTKVVTDDNGVLKGYEMFHGHGDPGDFAKTTERHFWEWPDYFNNHQKYPPLGYWSQYLVGIAPVFAGEPEAITVSTAN